jgi:hypothetical protein
MILFINLKVCFHVLKLGAHHRFTPSCTDWGFSSFIKCTDLNEADDGLPKPLLENDQLRIGVQVNVVHDETGYLWHSFDQ